MSPSQHYFSNDLVDVIKHLPIDEDEGWAFVDNFTDKIRRQAAEARGEVYHPLIS
jgi:hypothetical protein